MDNLTQNGHGTADTAGAEVKNEAAADLGKFKDVQALINAYNNLEAEFTRRSQRLRELEASSNPQRPAPNNGAQSPADSQAEAQTVKGANPQVITEAQLYDAASGNAAVKDRIIGDYIKSVLQNKGAPFVTGGVPAPSPKNKPATIKEAGRLAAAFLKQR